MGWPLVCPPFSTDAITDRPTCILGNRQSPLVLLHARRATRWRREYTRFFTAPQAKPMHNIRLRTSVRPTDRGAGGAASSRVVDLGFAHLDPELRHAAAELIAGLTRRRVLVFSDAESGHLWRDDLTRAGLDYVRTGAWIRENGAQQFSGDRPAVGFESITICHPKAANAGTAAANAPSGRRRSSSTAAAPAPGCTPPRNRTSSCGHSSNSSAIPAKPSSTPSPAPDPPSLPPPCWAASHRHRTRRTPLRNHRPPTLPSRPTVRHPPAPVSRNSLPCNKTQDRNRCRECGAQIVQPATGRPHDLFGYMPGPRLTSTPPALRDTNLMSWHN